MVSYNYRLQPNVIYGIVNSNYNQTLFVEYPNWGTTSNDGNVLGEDVGAAATPQPLGSLPYFNASFTYDKANRLTAASESGAGTWSRSFGYDQWGNMAVTANSGVPINGLTPYGSGQYNTANNRLVSGLVAYDASGNTTSLSTMRMGYTAENQFWIAYDVNSGVTVEYLPDGFGNRVWKQVTGGATTYYLYDALGQLAAEYTGPTALTKEYIRMGGQLVAIQNASGTPCSTCYVTYDHLGSVRLVTDQSANIVSRHDFLPFGEEIPAGYAGRSSQYGASDKINQRFTGQDRETENVVPVDYFNARNFTGVLGRFNSPDPGNAGADMAHPESWNGYSYVANNPLSTVDPFGLSCVTLDDGGLADDGDGNGCVGAGESPGDPADAGTLNQGQTNAQSNGNWDSISTNDTTPWQLGWQWATGTGPSQQAFGPNSPMTQTLQQHSHIQNVKHSICGQMRNGQVPPAGNVSANYSLSGLQGVPKYFGDYSTLLTGGATGNLAVTYLGSYALTYNVGSFDMSAGTATVQFHVSNSSTIESATHPPYIGYTQWWDQNVGQPLNNLFQSGPLSPTSQDFYWTANLNGCQVQ